MPKNKEFKDKSPYIILNINKRRLQELAKQGEEAQNRYIEDKKEEMIKSARRFNNKDDKELENIITQIEEAYSQIATSELREQYAQEEKRKADERKKEEYKKKLEARFGRTYS